MLQRRVVLLVDDDPNDVFLFQRAVRKQNIPVDVQVVNDGLDAIHYLSGKDAFADRERYPMPDLVITDTSMPNINGFDLLRWIKENASLVKIPAIVLSGAMSEASVKLAYKLGAINVAVKPSAVEEYMLRIKTILRVICREATAHIAAVKSSI